MGSRTQPNKVLLDIEDCVFELKRQSVDGKTPVNDDSPTLHRFQEKLELILSFGLIEKPGLLGPKKSYWHYICTCFASSKRNHDGINSVKSVGALKTPLGRGRAFIRFCLTEKCLADTLQSCFMNQKISRDFYTERSLPAQEKLWTALVTSLYDLNELNFDLCTGYTELDISWPKFARKLFSTSDGENLPHRNMSTPNLHTFMSQDEFYSANQNFDCSSLDICSYSSDSSTNVDASELTELNAKLSKENKSLQKEVECLKNEKSKLQCDIQALHKECLTLHQQLNISYKGDNKNKSTETKSEITDIFVDSNLTSSETTEAESSPKERTDGTSKNGLKGGKEMHSLAGNASLKSKLKNDNLQISSDCALQQYVSEIPARQILSSDMCSKDSENSQVNRNILQNPIYINELLVEIKTVIDDIEDTIQKSDGTLAIPHISRLKKIRNCLGDIFSSDVDKSKSYLNFNKFVENCISCIKNFSAKQENIINSLQERIELSVKGNQNLYSKIKTLKELLISYGFLKATNEKEINPENVLLPPDASSVLSKLSCEDFACDIAHDPVLKRIIIPLLPVLNSSFTKLNSLNEKMIELQFGLDSSQELNSHLITRVQDQEMHLKGVTKEIEEAQQLVSVLKKQHRKLQSAEGILKYDLQEKRKLLTRLKQQLENTREDFNLVRLKNSKSEAEWQDLHKEFIQRHKQTSEESGFVDDKGFEDQEAVFSNSPCDCSFPDESTSEKDSVSKESIEIPQSNKKKRLALLEEQCQNLYSSLLQSSKKRQEIDKRLESMCKTIEKSGAHMHSDTFAASDLPTEKSFENVQGAVIHTLEDNSQSMFTNDTLANSPQSSSDVGSLNSECSSCMPGICNEVSSSNSSYCDSSKADSCISFSPCKLQIGASQTSLTSEQMTETDVLHNSDCISSCNSESKDNDEMISSCDSAELTVNNVQNLEVQNISHVDSILIKKKDLEESLKNLEIDNEITTSEKRRFSHSEEFEKQICTFQNEKKLLLSKIQELEKKILMKSTELDQITQQLILSRAAKEHEVAALQFQLNTEALKYERALKEFSEQSRGLDNMKQRVTEQEQLILALEEALSEMHSDRENEREERWQESMSEAEEEHSRNEVLLCQLEQLKACNQKDRANMQTEVLNLKQYSRELQKKLIKLLKEKDILWKRNDHMCHLQKVKIDDRWMKDSEVSSCLACKNSFSFMVRKHHCRLCGRIFCYACANNWLMTASSSKKIRACNECFVQHMEIKKVVRRGSDVPHIDDSDDEANNGDISLNPASSCSFNSEIPSSITNSILSLPITQKHSTPHFASAPDLRYVHKPYAISSCSISLAEDHLEGKEEEMEINEHVNKDFEHRTEISSDECTSLTVEEDIPKSLKEDHLESKVEEMQVSCHGNEDFEHKTAISSNECACIVVQEDTKSVTENHIESKKEEVQVNEHTNKDFEQNTEISSNECISVIVEEDVPKINRLIAISVDTIMESEGGVNGKLIVLSGVRVDFPIFCETCPVLLEWSFTSNCKSIPFVIIHEGGSCDSNSTIFYETIEKMQDQKELSVSGYYVFQFDNTVRNTEMEIKYSVSAKHLN